MTAVPSSSQRTDTIIHPGYINEYVNKWTLNMIHINIWDLNIMMYMNVLFLIRKWIRHSLHPIPYLQMYVCMSFIVFSHFIKFEACAAIVIGKFVLVALIDYFCFSKMRYIRNWNVFSWLYIILALLFLKRIKDYGKQTTHCETHNRFKKFYIFFYNYFINLTFF